MTISLSITELVALLMSVATMATTAGAYFAVFKRMQAELRWLRRTMRQDVIPRLNNLDGGKPTTRELPAFDDAEDSAG